MANDFWNDMDMAGMVKMMEEIDRDVANFNMPELLVEEDMKKKSKLKAEQAKRMNRQRNVYVPSPPRRHQGR